MAVKQTEKSPCIFLFYISLCIRPLIFCSWSQISSELEIYILILGYSSTFILSKAWFCWISGLKGEKWHAEWTTYLRCAWFSRCIESIDRIGTETLICDMTRLITTTHSGSTTLLARFRKIFFICHEFQRPELEWLPDCHLGALSHWVKRNRSLQM